MKSINGLLASLFTLVLLTACGGGGGATGLTGNAGLGTTVTTGVSITDLKAPNVAAAVWNGISAVTGSANGAASAPPLITGVVANASDSRFSLARLLFDQLGRVPELQNAPGDTGIVGIAGIPLNVSCTLGGSAKVTATIDDPAFSVLSVGDTLGVTFFMCNEIGVVLDGALDMQVSAIQGGGTFDGLPPFNITLDTAFNTLRALDGSEYYYWNGDMQLVLVDDSIGNFHAIMSGTSLDTSYNNQYPLMSAYHDQRLTDYLFDISGNNDSLSANYGDYAIDLDGTVESSDIDGTVTFTTTSTALGAATFTGNEFAGNGDPDAGVLLVQSNFGGLSQLWLAAQPGGVSVLIDVDVDGDDIVDTTIPTTWAALEAL